MIKRALLFIFVWLLLNISFTAAQENNVSRNTAESENSSALTQKTDSQQKNAVLKNTELKNTEQDNTERFYVIKINLKIVDDMNKELVNSSWERATLSGKSVGIHLKGNNLSINADMTPYYVDKKSVLLLARGNIKLKPVGSDVNKFYSTVNSLPIKLGERALFFPLGLLDEKMENISSCVLEIEVQPYGNIDSTNGSGSEQIGEKIKKE